MQRAGSTFKDLIPTLDFAVLQKINLPNLNDCKFNP